MPPDAERSGPLQEAAPTITDASVPPAADTPRPRRYRRVEIDRDPRGQWQVVAWATAWLEADHSNDEACPTCAAGWRLLDGEAAS